MCHSLICAKAQHFQSFNVYWRDACRWQTVHHDQPSSLLLMMLLLLMCFKMQMIFLNPCSSNVSHFSSPSWYKTWAQQTHSANNDGGMGEWGGRKMFQKLGLKNCYEGLLHKDFRGFNLRKIRVVWHFSHHFNWDTRNVNGKNLKKVQWVIYRNLTASKRTIWGLCEMTLCLIRHTGKGPSRTDKWLLYEGLP